MIDPEDLADAGVGPLFRKTMQYRCDVGETEVVRYLENGCEGPAVETRVEENPVEFGPPTIQVNYTVDGRMVVPVPFVAGRCPNGHTMRHVDWARDQILPVLLPASHIPPTEYLESGAPSVFIFRYPDDVDTNTAACGIPTEWFPGHNMARTETVVHHQVDPDTGLWVEREMA